MARLYLGIVLHNHQPVGNYGFVIEHLYEQAYEPMLAALERHAGIRVAFHNSGPLWDWLEQRRPEYIERLRTLCTRGQVEMMTGGYYEPILPMVPDGDKIGQIQKLTSYIERQFGQHPAGLWLTERVWEPGLPAPLSRAGVEWTPVDDAHFRTVGMPQSQLDGYYVTEDQGRRINVFAGSQRLRYTIPWLDVPDLIEELRWIAEQSRDDAYIVLGDDGEKFGGWPTTYTHVWESGWLDRFFSAVEEQADWLEVITPGAYMREHEARGLAYLPAASYAEMMEWSMPPDAATEYHRIGARLHDEHREEVLRYVRGGFWRYFLARYPEANAMHKRGLRIAEKLGRADSAEARDALWQGQCNCPYWHGVFGGLYLRNIRAATNSNLVRAERLADEAARRDDITVERRDFDYDGHAEILVQTRELSLMFHPSRGGMISEVDLRKRDHALLDVVPRYREAYHADLIEGTAGATSEDLTNIHGGVRFKEEGLADAIVFDNDRRGGLQDGMLDADVGPDDYAAHRYEARFDTSGAWTADVQRVEGGVVVRQEREASGWRIAKEVEIPLFGERVSVRYECMNTTAKRRYARLVSEWNISVPQDRNGDDRIAMLRADGDERDLTAGAGTVEARSFELRGSAGYVFEIGGIGAIEAWHMPVHTVSSSEGGLERVWQGTCVALTRTVDLAPWESTSFEFSLGVGGRVSPGRVSAPRSRVVVSASPRR